MTQQELDQFKADSRSLYSKGLISQRLCVGMLGLVLPTGTIYPFVLKMTARLASYLIRSLK